MTSDTCFTGNIRTTKLRTVQRDFRLSVIVCLLDLLSIHFLLHSFQAFGDRFHFAHEVILASDKIQHVFPHDVEIRLWSPGRFAEALVDQQPQFDHLILQLLRDTAGRIVRGLFVIHSLGTTILFDELAIECHLFRAKAFLDRDDRLRALHYCRCHGVLVDALKGVG